MKNLGSILGVIGLAVTLSSSLGHAEDIAVKASPVCRGLYDALRLQLGIKSNASASKADPNPLIQVDPGADPNKVIVRGSSHRYMQVIGVNLIHPDKNAFSTRLDQANVIMNGRNFIIPQGPYTVSNLELMTPYYLREAESTRKAAIAADHTVAFDANQHPAFYMTPFKIGSKPGRFYVQKNDYYADPYKTTASIGQCGSIGCIHIVDTSLGYPRKQDIYVSNSDLWQTNAADTPDYPATLRWTLKDVRERINDAKRESAALEIDPADFASGSMMSASGVSLSEYRKAQAPGKLTVSHDNDREKSAALNKLRLELGAQNCLASPQGTQRSTAGVADAKHGDEAGTSAASPFQSGGKRSSGIPK